MHTKEKQALVTIISSTVVMALYALWVFKKQVVPNPEIVNSLPFWGKYFMLFIPIAIVALIIIYIVFAIINKIVTNEDMDEMTDERDKLIELKTIRISHWIFTAGFFLAMGSQALGMQTWVMMVTFIVSGLLSGLVSETARFIMYRRGF